jgi:type IV pilus assembly protein PilO
MRFGLRELMLLAILLAVPLSSYWLVFRPQNAEITQARQEIEHKRSVLDKLREETSRSRDLERANNEIQQSIHAIEARLPNSTEIDAVVRQVSDLAVEAGLPAPQLKSLKPVKAALYMEQPLEMTIPGDFKNFYQFLLKVEQLPRVTRILDLTLKRNDEKEKRGPKDKRELEEKKPAMTSQFTLSIYFQDDTNQGAKR